MIRLATQGAMSLLLVAACSNDDTGTGMDMGKNDLAMPRDMVSSQSDMTMPQADMARPPPTLTIPGSCAVATVTLASFYSVFINGTNGNKCASNSSCHVLGGQLPRFTPDMNGFRTNIVNVNAFRMPQAPNMMYIRPNDPDNSFILYKITGQQDKVINPGIQMPYNLPALSDAEQCTLINWVRSGAN